MNKINVITLFPEVFENFFKLIPYKNLLKNGSLTINLVNLRDFGLGNYKKVDDTPYGGGPGMILMIEPIFNALQSLNSTEQNFKVLLSPRGKRFNQKTALDLSEKQEVTLICGRYEGVDARVEELCDSVLSVGDFVLSGGEVAALAIMETALRLVPGALGDIESISDESFSEATKEQVEYPQYTRPEIFTGKAVPKELLSGDHKLIQHWRTQHRTFIPN